MTEAYAEVWAGDAETGGWVCGICGRPVETEPCPIHVGLDHDPLFTDEEG